MVNKAIIVVLIIVIIAVPVYFTYFEEDKVDGNKKPIVEITYPQQDATVSKIVIISGTASDPDGDDKLLEVEVMINNGWELIEGNTKWCYEWVTFDIEDGYYRIKARSWDGTDYSEIEELGIKVYNLEVVESDAHKWAIFIAASNFPEDNESKLGNGALNLAEDMTAFFIENLGYSTNNIIILFDDGWIREKNGYGKPIETLQERKHQYDITYGGATKDTVTSSINYIVEVSNKFDDSEIFIWIASHGYGDETKKLFGGKILQRSAVFLWDDPLTDKDLGNLLLNLKSEKTCVIVDACYSGGFADKTIFNLPEFFLLKSKVPSSGRVVMTGTSKFRIGYASTKAGPLFSQLWFNGLTTGDADGFRPFIAKMGRPPRFNFFKDGKVSVEEAFYYARCVLRGDNQPNDYKQMQPQINDQYPKRGPIRSLKGLILGE
jgi:hypothetical protein